jgi:3-phosphoshikimate 1-carboxyvinyltransferase
LACLPAELELPIPPSSPFSVRVRPPGSKSLTNRAILLGALAKGRTVLSGALADAEDAVAMRQALTALGARIVDASDGSTLIDGVDGRWHVPSVGVTLGLNNAGTGARFLAGSAILSPGRITIDGNARMRQRPIGELGALLTQLGCSVEYLGTPGCPPVRITPPPEPDGRGKLLEVESTQSSQFVSALLLAAPWVTGGITLRMQGTITSASYIGMTLGLLSRLGVCVQTSDHMRVIRVRGSWRHETEENPVVRGMEGFTYVVEPDASGATYFWAAAALVPGASVLIEGLDDRSLQGDAKFGEMLMRMGAQGATDSNGISIRGASLTPILADMADMPDAAMTLAVVACFAGGTSILKGVGTLRVKECDRIEAMKTELAKVGVRVESPVSGDDGVMTITPPEGGLDCSGIEPVVFDTYDDHRIAMALSLLALRRPGVRIRNPRCVAKTYPTYWTEFARLWRSDEEGT